MKVRRSISLSEDTLERLIWHAKIRHTNVSQLITDWVWKTCLPDEPKSAVELDSPDDKESEH